MIAKLESSILTAAQVQELLAPHLLDVSACIDAGWEKWKALCKSMPEVGLETSRRTRAGIVYDGTIAEARSRFRDKPGVNVTNRRGLILVAFEGLVVLRFKKYSMGLRTSNIPTGQQRLLEWQEPLPDLPPAATNVVAGYVLDSFEANIARVVMTCRRGPKLRWAFDIPRSAGETLPMPQKLDQAGPSRPLVRREPSVEEDERGIQ